MQSYSRSLSLTAALLIGAAICLFVAAAPPQLQEEKGERRKTPVVAPISLSDADGQELILEDISVRVAIHGMLSLTEMEFRFRNPKPRRIEGRFACTLPAGATISRFAKEVSGQMMEGEVVERLRANQVYESYLHQMRDPALLEQDQGNRFSARIFPIEANESVRILLSHTRLLSLRDGTRTYTLPLRGLAGVRHFSFRAFVTPIAGEKTTSGLARSSADVLSMDERDYTPEKDIELSWNSSADAPQTRILRAGDYYLAAFASPAVRRVAATGSSAWSFYVDTSASSAEGSAHRIRALEALIGALPPDDSVQIHAFDNEVSTLFTGSAWETQRSIGDLLRARLFIGGTDLGAAFRHAANTSRRSPDRVIVFASDFVATLGATSTNEILAATRAIPARRLHALILGSRQDSQTARALTEGRGRIVTVPFSDLLAESAAQAAGALRLPLGEVVSVSDPSAEWIYPTRFSDVQPGDELLVLAKSRSEAAPQWSAATGGAVLTSLVTSTFEPLLEREAHRAYLDYLAGREAAESSEAVRRALGAEQVRISVEQRVVIPRTTMLVLENEGEYQRWGIDRRALAAILTVGAGGIERIDRRAEPPQTIGMRRQIPVTLTPPPSNVFADVNAGQVPAQVMKSAEPAAAESGVVSRTTQDDMPFAPSIAPRRRVEEKLQAIDWTHPPRVTREQAGDLRKRLQQDPRDRALYNQLSDALVALGDWRGLRDLALAWQPFDPENPQVYEILGLAAENLEHPEEAARAYASLIELAPAKTELLQRAGLLLVRVKHAKLAETPLRRALELRPDRANSYRHLALMLWLDGRPEEAARVLESALGQTFPAWYGDVHRVIREELGYAYRSWGAANPGDRAEIADRAAGRNINLDRRDALRITLAWETDANDVDLHVVDPAGEQCFYSNNRNGSGLELYGDITQGLGPEVIRTSSADRGTYHVGVRYFAAGPMGVSRGLVVIIQARKGTEATVKVVPFRLVEGGGEIRYVAGVEME